MILHIYRYKLAYFFIHTSELVQFCVTPVLRYEGRSLSDFLDLEEDRRRKNKCCRFR
jgi:hypothetical protein